MFWWTSLLWTLQEYHPHCLWLPRSAAREEAFVRNETILKSATIFQKRKCRSKICNQIGPFKSLAMPLWEQCPCKQDSTNYSADCFQHRIQLAWYWKWSTLCLVLACKTMPTDDNLVWFPDPSSALLPLQLKGLKINCCRQFLNWSQGTGASQEVWKNLSAFLPTLIWKRCMLAGKRRRVI